MPELPSLSLSRIIGRAYRFGDFLLIIIYGALRSGKSAYAMKVMGQVYEYFFGRPLSIDLIDQYMGFHPNEVVQQWMEITKPLPMYIWDDAGFWLYSMDWNDPLLKAVQKYINVIGTDMSCLMLTTPDPTWILSKLLNMPGTLRGRVIKSDSIFGASDSPSKLWARKVRGYKPYRSPDLKKTGVNVKWEDTYSCYIQDDVYEYYFPKRKHYATMAKQNIGNVLLKVRAKAKKEDESMKDTVKGLDYLTDRGVVNERK